MKIWKIALGKIAAAAATAADKKCASYASAVRKSVRNEFPAIWSPKLPLGAQHGSTSWRNLTKHPVKKLNLWQKKWPLAKYALIKT